MVAIWVVFVLVAAVGAAGVPVNVGLAERTVLPVPVEVVTPVPPFATGSVPVTFVVKLAKVVDVVPVPPLAIGSVPVTWDVKLTLANVPPRVKLPVLVTVPVRVMPLTVPVPPTLVTPSATLEATLT